MYTCIIGKTELHVGHDLNLHVHVVVQFYSWFKFYFSLFLRMVIYDNELKTKGNKN